MNIPRPEYPRPTLVRGNDSWVNLNGKWEFAFDFGSSGRDRKMWEAEKYEHEIIVPFVPESEISGLGHLDFIISCWYRRKIEIPVGWDKNVGRVLLHFGAVDYYSEIRINGVVAGTHTGGFTPFTVDITEYLSDGENVLSVYVVDNGRSSLQPTGKQVYDRYDAYRMSYPRCTGIWQTVWMEYVPKNYIKTLKLTPDIDAGKLDVIVTFEGTSSGVKDVMACASFAGETVSEMTAPVLGKYAQFSLPIPDAKLWSIEEPNLYDLTVTAGEDTVYSYFGMRSVAINGYAIEINHKPVYQRLVLDQGYFPDGIYTPEKDEAFIRDIELSKAAGFNGARMHMKVFDPRYIYHADRLGYILWGEFPNFGLDDSNPAALLSVMPEWLAELERDYNHPSIVGWCPFNETSNARNAEVLRTLFTVTRAIDPMRPIIDTSGYVHVITDIFDVHNYEYDTDAFKKAFEPLLTGEGVPFVNNPGVEKYEGQPYFVSEFGGALGWPADKKAPDSEIEDFYRRFEAQVSTLLDNPKMCAFCYTQLVDVYQENNGIYLFDRGEKFDVERLRKIISRKAAIETED